MKIRYISEGYIKNIDQLKAGLNKRLSADDIRNQAKKIIIEPILEDREFLRKCGNCFKTFIHVNANTTPPAVLDFRYVSLENGVLTVVCEAHYTGNATERNRATAKSVLIENKVFEKYTVAEISAEIDDYINKRFQSYFKKTNKEILDTVQRIHVERIDLWANAPESENGIFPEKLGVRFMTEFYWEKILSESEVSDLFDKVNRLFTFCCNETVLEKRDFNFRHDVSSKDLTNILLELNKSIAKRSFDGTYKEHFDSKSLAGMSRKDLYLYFPTVVIRKIDLKKYLVTKDLNKSTYLAAEEKSLNDNPRILTTATPREIESIKNSLGSFLISDNRAMGYYFSYNSALGMPSPKTGFIEYLAFVKRLKTSYKDSWVIKDYIDGESHNNYEFKY